MFILKNNYMAFGTNVDVIPGLNLILRNDNAMFLLVTERVIVPKLNPFNSRGFAESGSFEVWMVTVLHMCSNSRKPPVLFNLKAKYGVSISYLDAGSDHPLNLLSDINSISLFLGLQLHQSAPMHLDGPRKMLKARLPSPIY